jgi:hypothetical protein
MRISDPDIANAARQAGFAGPDLVTAVAIAIAESGGNPTAVNRRNRNGTADFGLWQINSVHNALLKQGNWQNPADNARMAKAVYDDAGGFRPWAVYNSQKYRIYVPRATTAVGVAPAVDVTNAPPISDKNDAETFTDTLTSGETWRRVVLFLVGGFLFLLGLMRMTGDNQLSGTTKTLIRAAVTRKISR